MKKFLTVILCGTILMGAESARAEDIVGKVHEALGYLQLQGGISNLTTEEKAFLSKMVAMNNLLKNEPLFDDEDFTTGRDELTEARDLSAQVVDAYQDNQVDRFRELKAGFNEEEAIEKMDRAIDRIRQEMSLTAVSAQEDGFLLQLFGMKTAYAAGIPDCVDVGLPDGHDTREIDYSTGENRGWIQRGGSLTVLGREAAKRKKCEKKGKVYTDIHGTRSASYDGLFEEPYYCCRPRNVRRILSSRKGKACYAKVCGCPLGDEDIGGDVDICCNNRKKRGFPSGKLNEEHRLCCKENWVWAE